MTCYDLLIVGAGPAGCAAALRARALGLSVAMLAEARRRPGVPESLPPAGRRLLVDLGCWQPFLDSTPTPSRGMRAAWGSRQPAERPSIFDPDGSGWHVDRAAFDSFLQEQAIRAGAVLWRGRLRGVWQDGAAMVCLDSTGGVLAGRFVLDASGRPAAAAGRLGARRRYDDAAVAALSSYQTPASDTDRRTVLGATPEGWWYSLRTDRGVRVLGRVTDADLDGVPAALPPGVPELLDGARLQAPPRRVAANSGYLQPFAGPRWAAAGDAALCFDPLSSQGMLTALYTGQAAARAIAAALAGSESALIDYARRLDGIRQAYQANLALTYGFERRWTAEPFWLRRHGRRPVAGVAALPQGWV